MKQRLIEKSERELLAEYPLKSRTPGWYFKLDEVSNGYWRLAGADRWGRKIAIDGTDPDALLERAEAEAAVLKK